jgi:hypothetical protein
MGCRARLVRIVGPPIERLQCPPGRPVARVIGVRARAAETAMQPATVLAMIAAARHSGRLNGMAECTLARRDEGPHASS